jgi:2-hydroxychromene-2-carboxylate isomerase
MKKRQVQYWFSTASPWAWLGSARFAELVRAEELSVEVLPIDLSEVFAATGGTPFQRRSAARQSYRQLELARWSRRLGTPINPEPPFYPVDRGPSSRLLIAGRKAGLNVLPLSHAVLRAIWQENRDIADWAELLAIANGMGFDGASLIEAAQRSEVHEQYLADTGRAVAEQVFGSPTYVVEGERFWGQDRLEMLAERVSR